MNFLDVIERELIGIGYREDAIRILLLLVLGNIEARSDGNQHEKVFLTRGSNAGVSYTWGTHI